MHRIQFWPIALISSFIPVGAIALDLLLTGNAAQAQSLRAQSVAAQCPLTGTWLYNSPKSVVYRNRQYSDTATAYSTSVQLTEGETRQEKISEGNTQRTVVVATVSLSNTDPVAKAASANTPKGTRIGEQAGFLLAIPVEGLQTVDATLQGTISPDCRTIQGQAAVGDKNIPFTMQRPDGSVANSSGGSSRSLTGEWVSVIIDKNSKPDIKHLNRLTQNGNQLQLQSGISGDTFSGIVSGQRVEIRLFQSTTVGTISSDGNRITSPDLVMVRIGSPGCQTYETCKIP